MADTGALELVEASYSQKPVVRQLLELYLYEFSEMESADVDEHGLFGYRYLDHYWTEPDRYPFLFRVDGKWAGFALVRRMSYFEDAAQPCHALAEFFVMRRYRRQGVGRKMAVELFERFSGRWEVAEMPANMEAQAFWRRVIGSFTENRLEEHMLANDRWHGPVQVFRSP